MNGNIRRDNADNYKNMKIFTKGKERNLQYVINEIINNWHLEWQEGGRRLKLAGKGLKCPKRSLKGS